ncbi:Crp/Fnr family transcriptional regulator [Streptomyces cellulosae]|jgi:CRP-like cAMP-binding protein|uniref:Crp/Fnr family transcriptional regulator n=2 Tax=Streptomyces TaxID=1883 RepID=A0ABU3IZZ5_9ACTN|nr:Crp/Fnr family transcriptional regulator [Streptomyces sp. McG7]MBT2908834.1 Crp/Fnr family transcriptional regulator [Streptomyces sp. McG8]MCX4479833.1 Crp/Fnr family transcriptional regulator [Streptomyces cellulosae]MDQ0486153.1 CRP-like cAMP-binding protein [Streptomyces thermodiastaticus]MDT6968382.1 Crp/Fnr family transcriptional regulator [Streptomyces thermocarboxydus]MDX3417295.1 Crp/Fnr family transcriptional regulator [Streptomyces sp. MD20-1-1]MXQ56593.1 cyclic nucleotide-bind
MALVVQDRTFLDALSDEARKDLFRISVERTFRADEHLLHEQDDSSHVLVLLEGWAVVSTATDRSSARLILALRRRGEVVGEMAALGGIRRSASVTALGPVRTLVVPGARFRAFAGRDPQVSAVLMAQLVSRLRTADEERRTLASLTVLQRVARRLLELADLQGAPSAPTATHGTGTGDAYPVLAQFAQHDLADAVGATREAVAKSLRLLRTAGVVRTRPRRIELIDHDALRLLAAGGNIGF